MDFPKYYTNMDFNHWAGTFKWNGQWQDKTCSPRCCTQFREATKNQNVPSTLTSFGLYILMLARLPMGSTCSVFLSKSQQPEQGHCSSWKAVFHYSSVVHRNQERWHFLDGKGSPENCPPQACQWCACRFCHRLLQWMVKSKKGIGLNVFHRKYYQLRNVTRSHLPPTWKVDIPSYQLGAALRNW